MTPLPKKKHTRSRSATRKISQRLSLGSLVKCPNCSKLKWPHKACPSCGKYK
ncbi:50S ribosomal protein L32 [Patescibacteria group bacterium]|nr:50S ribosomal protein L32 [Patescibacteria group bacterium]